MVTRSRVLQNCPQLHYILSGYITLAQ